MWLLIRYKQNGLYDLCRLLEKYKLILDYYIPSMDIQKEKPAMLNYCFLCVEDRLHFEATLISFPFKFKIETNVTEKEIKNIKDQLDIIQKNLPGGLIIGDTVIIQRGPFANFAGEIIELKSSTCNIKIIDSIMGRQMKIELEYRNIAKVDVK